MARFTITHGSRLQVSLKAQLTDGLREIEEASFSAPAADTAAISSGPYTGACSSGEVAAEGGRCAAPQLSLPQQNPADGSDRPPREAPSSAAPPPPHLQTAPPRTGAWGGLPLTSLADASEGCDEGAGGAAAHRLGLFRFKGSPETLSMVDIVPSSLAGRR